MDSTASRPVSSVPLLDVGRGNQPLMDEISAAIRDVCESGRFLHGPDVGRLEATVAEVCQTEYAVSCGSGSDALLLSLMALGIQPGDEVIVPSFTFFATASAAWRLGAQVVFADIEPDTFNICPQKIAAAITDKTKAIIPVHLFGQCAAMEAILEIARERNIAVVEDAAQAIGAARGGRPAGSMGDIGCFSFYPTKNLGGFGDGGMMTTNDGELAERLRLVAAHGMNPRYYHSVVGINSRLDTIQAAVLNVKIKHLAKWSEQRRANAARYGSLMQTTGIDQWLTLPADLPNSDHVWNQFTVRVPAGCRDALRNFLGEAKIGSEVYYPVPLHQQECFASLGYETGSFPETDRAAAEVLSLPIFPELMIAEQQAVIDRIAQYQRALGSAAA
ncbi:MAG: dTDP-4-amino-4,6-dideoxygalactose transaminase [Pirellulaceae bacterium]|jgi:dTDP-4-amino-4,6-dideoxygalactose transaminase